MPYTPQGGFIRDDATGAIVVKGLGGGTPFSPLESGTVLNSTTPVLVSGGYQ